MIALLRGRIATLGNDAAIIDTGGVGYQVNCNARTLAWLHDSGDGEVVLHVHTSVSDDAIRLYGFASLDELRLFRLLISVERIGPKAALAILGRAELTTLALALRDGDAALLATVPGVGRKTAERVVLELRGKVGWLAGPGGTQVSPATAKSDAAAEALVGLGFHEAEVRSALVAVRSTVDADNVNALVAAALRQLDQGGA